MGIRFRRKSLWIPWQEFSMRIAGFADDGTFPTDGANTALANIANVFSVDGGGTDQVVNAPVTGVHALAGTGPYGLFEVASGTGAAFTATQATSLMTAPDMSTDGDEIDYFGVVPNDLDIRQPVGVRVLWTSNNATAGATDTADWIVSYTRYAEGDALISPATALDTVVTAADVQSAAAARALNMTARGVINANTFRQGYIFWGYKV